MLDILAKKHIVAKEGFNRWLIAPAALGIHLCIGSVYAWSLFNPALIKRVGVVTSAADDWTLKSVVWIKGYSRALINRPYIYQKKLPNDLSIIISFDATSPVFCHDFAICGSWVDT